jgi:hypothetical protein
MSDESMIRDSYSYIFPSLFTVLYTKLVVWYYVLLY